MDAGIPKLGHFPMSPRCAGHTLVELLAVVLLMAILLALAAPSFSRLMERNRAAAVFHQLTTSMALARMAAIHRGHPVTVCPTRDGRVCRRDLVWEEGWMSFLDAERAGQPASPDDVLERYAQSRGSLAVRGTPGRHRVRFQPSGWARGANISLRVCARAQARLLGAVVVNNAGRPRTERRDDPAGSCPYPP
jgi:type IV fimbrial biogenesis protein FimT